jgi:hypothetical protein
VTNNVVITSACHGITFASIHNSLIADNTVVEDGLVSTPGCVAAINVGGATHAGSLQQHGRKEQSCEPISIDTRNPGLTADHNVALCCASPEFAWYERGHPV